MASIILYSILHLFLVWGMFTSFSLYLWRQALSIFIASKLLLGSDLVRRETVTARSALLGSRLIQSLGHRSRIVRGCISCLEINWFSFPFPKTAHKWLLRSSVWGARRRAGRSFFFHLVSCGKRGRKRTMIIHQKGCLSEKNRNIHLGGKKMGVYLRL